VKASSPKSNTFTAFAGQDPTVRLLGRHSDDLAEMPGRGGCLLMQRVLSTMKIMDYEPPPGKPTLSRVDERRASLLGLLDIAQKTNIYGIIMP